MRFIFLLLIVSFVAFAEENTEPKKAEVAADIKTAVEVKFDKKHVLKLIKQLGAEGFRERKVAKKILVEFTGEITSILNDQLKITKSIEIKESLKDILQERIIKVVSLKRNIFKSETYRFPPKTSRNA